MSEARTVSQKCPNCGAGVVATSQKDRFACPYCGAAIVVEVSAATRMAKGTERGAAELALQRLKDDLAAAKTAVLRHEALTAQRMSDFDARVEALGDRQTGLRVWVDAFGVALPAMLCAAIIDHFPVFLVLVALVVGWWLAKNKRDVAGRLASLFYGWAILYVVIVLAMFPFSDGGTKPLPRWVPLTLLGVTLPFAFVWSALRASRKKTKRLAALAVVETERAAAKAALEEEARPLRARVADIEDKIAENRARADS